jgi:hypothetical protein
MKRILLFFFVSMLGTVTTLSAQKWEDLSKEQKMGKVKEFRDDNQAYLKSLGLNEEQLSDIDNVNICFLSTLDRIDRYGGDDASKKKYAKTALGSRSAQLDAIMGADKRKQYIAYVQEKLSKVIPAE